MKKFTLNQKLSTSSICDSECIYTSKVLKRTEKTVTIKIHGEQKRCKIHIYDDCEFFYPFGRHSMAPTFRA